MRLTLDTSPALTAHLPALRPDAIRARAGQKHVESRQRFTVDLLNGSYVARNRHSRYPDANAFGRDFLREGFQAENTRPLTTPFWESWEGQGGYSMAAGVCKAYWLRPEVSAVLFDVFEGDTPLDAFLDRGDGAGPIAFGALPANGIPEPVAEHLHVPKVLPLGTASIDRALTQLAVRIDAESISAPLDSEKGRGSLTLLDARARLRACRHWALSFGGLPNLYRQETSGRLGPVGDCHIIGLPRLLRQLLFEGSGLVDYDIVACHWNVARSLAIALDVDTPAMDEYLADRSRTHRRWAKLTGRDDPDVFKPVALSWLTGGTLTGHWKTAAGATLGQAAVRQLAQDPFAQRLHTEARTVMQRISAETVRVETDGQETVYVNAVRGRLQAENRKTKKPVSDAQLYSHLLTGYEQFAIQCVCRSVEGLMGVVYDGFVAPKQDHLQWEALVGEASAVELGITLHLSFKPSEFTQVDW